MQCINLWTVNTFVFNRFPAMWKQLTPFTSQQIFQGSVTSASWWNESEWVVQEMLSASLLLWGCILQMSCSLVPIYCFITVFSTSVSAGNDALNHLFSLVLVIIVKSPLFLLLSCGQFFYRNQLCFSTVVVWWRDYCYSPISLIFNREWLSRLGRPCKSDNLGG